MADGDRKKGAAPSGARSTAASRAAQRRVTLPEGSSRPPTPAARVVRPPRPFWKKGGFWFAVIVAEALGGIGLSYVFALDPDSVSLDGGDRAAFCEQVRQYQVEGVLGTKELDITNVRAEFEHQAAGYRRLAGVAPDVLRPDLEKVARMTDELIATTDDVLRRKQADPSYLEAMADISKKQGDVTGRAVSSIDRIDKVVLRACDIDINAPPKTTTTTAVTTPATPGGSTPGGTTGSDGTVAPGPGATSPDAGSIPAA